MKPVSTARRRYGQCETKREQDSEPDCPDDVVNTTTSGSGASRLPNFHAGPRRCGWPPIRATVRTLGWGRPIPRRATLFPAEV